ncbi:MAG: hypothetical protein IKO10_09800 [Lachnospiraceae bacterium]|nr:hypothetical protein [Lachnospiraceae bacterium]
MSHHSLDPYPIPKDSVPLYINEPWLIDRSLLEYPLSKEPEDTEDNIRIYAPIDLNHDAILRRLEYVIARYGEANEDNEMCFSVDVDALISQIEVYDQVWYVRHMPKEGDHSQKAIDLVKDFIKRLEEIPDGCAECFPFDTIEQLKGEYLA